MSRRNTILIAVCINTVLFIFLFCRPLDSQKKEEEVLSVSYAAELPEIKFSSLSDSPHQVVLTQPPAPVADERKISLLPLEKDPSPSRLKAKPKQEIQMSVLEGVPSAFYLVQAGDNPWTIAAKHHMKVDDLLRLNQMSPEKARRIQPGQQIRIR